MREWFERDRDAMQAELRDSKLRGRGGAGFPVHLKWQSCREAPGAVKYIVCNADEGDPGAYIDKYLMEEQPHSVLFGMMVAGWFAARRSACSTSARSIRIPIERMNAAVQELRDAGWLGKNIQGSGFDFDFKTIKGAGRLHLRRGDRAAREHRRPASRGARASAVPHGGGPVPQADRA